VSSSLVRSFISHALTFLAHDCLSGKAAGLEVEKTSAAVGIVGVWLQI